MTNGDRRKLIRELKKIMDDTESAILYTKICEQLGAGNISDKNKKAVVANLNNSKNELISKMFLLFEEIDSAINKMK